MAAEPDLAFTQLLNRFADGDVGAEAELMPHLHAERHRMALRNLRTERQGHTLQPTALVHEVYLRMVGKKAAWNGRAHFFAVAARVMRNVLVDYARARSAVKRGSAAAAITLDDNLAISDEKCETVLYVHQALERLAELDERQARVVEMRFFGGMTEEEIALLLGVSSKTVKRDWAMAKAWLAAALSS